MTISRAARGLLALAIFLVATFVAAPAGHAQDSVPVTLKLVSQTPWSTLKDPMLDFAVRADNAGAAAIGDLTLGITIGSAVRSRTAYETSLTTGPELPIIFAVTLPEKDTVEPGGTRRFHTSVDLSTIGGISRTDSLVYPMRIDLRSAGVQVAVVDTPVIVVVRTPEVPLLVQTTIELTAPPAFDPDGRLVDTAFEASIARLAPSRRRWPRSTGWRAVPRSAPSIWSSSHHCSTSSAGWPTGINERTAAGRGRHGRRLERHRCPRRAPPRGLLAAGPRFGDAVLRPHHPVADRERSLDGSCHTASGRTRTRADGPGRRPGLGGRAPSRRGPGRRGGLRARGARAPRRSWATPTPSNARRNRTSSRPRPQRRCGRRSDVDLVLPDTGTQALLAQPGLLEDPVRAAQASIGELATIWREQPVPSQPRGISVLLPAGLPPRFWARSSDGWPRRRSSAGRRDRPGGAGPATRGAQRHRVSRDRALLLHLRRRHQACTPRPVGVPIDARRTTPLPIVSVSRSSTPSQPYTSATRPRGSRGSTTSTR